VIDVGVGGLSGVPSGQERDPVWDNLADAASATVTASRALLGMIAASLAPVLEQVSPPQFRVLVLLSVLGSMRIGVLAQRLGVHQSTVTRTVERLTAAGFVCRTRNPDNGREVWVEATVHGQALVRTVTERRYQDAVATLSRLTPAERGVVIAGMALYASAAGEPTVESLANLGG
jgi:DNA-binding MarR family transcriptional regulator